MNNLPKISIVTIVRNDPEGFLITARSVIKQNYANIEWIVIDGASTDATSHYVKNLSSMITNFKIEPDTGIYNAMNKSIKMITGDWVLFLNADDVFYSENVLSDYVDNIELQDDVLYSDVLRRENLAIQRYREDNQFKLGMVFDHQSAFVRTELYKKHKYDENLKISGDLDFFSKLRNIGCKFRKIDKLISIRKPFETGASSTYSSRQIERVTVLLKHFYSDELCSELKKEFLFAHKRKDLNNAQYKNLLKRIT